MKSVNDLFPDQKERSLASSILYFISSTKTIKSVTDIYLGVHELMKVKGYELEISDDSRIDDISNSLYKKGLIRRSDISNKLVQLTGEGEKYLPVIL